MAEFDNGRFLLLIRQSAVHIDQQKSSNEWSLSAEGREQCHQFASLIAPYHPPQIITSKENKAMETGWLLARVLRVSAKSAENLHEHDRQGEIYKANQQDFHKAIARFFSFPEELVFGRETAVQASERIDFAIMQLIDQHPGHNLAIVTHGTVLSLFVNRYNPWTDLLTFWESLKMPCAALLRLPDLAFQELILPSTYGEFSPSISD